MRVDVRPVWSGMAGPLPTLGRYSRATGPRAASATTHEKSQPWPGTARSLVGSERRLALAPARRWECESTSDWGQMSPSFPSVLMCMRVRTHAAVLDLRTRRDRGEPAVDDPRGGHSFLGRRSRPDWSFRPCRPEQHPRERTPTIRTTNAHPRPPHPTSVGAPSRPCPCRRADRVPLSTGAETVRRRSALPVALALEREQKSHRSPGRVAATWPLPFRTRTRLRPDPGR